ncbi:uncharacterized protein LOC129727584 isoform X2 [Wyeomyia smithii]|uniref:uncharacterized protein LOC129727584 isoform X2 n=1 Tax=Wyeomyia smithii TaxID=174621 RepID=UPI002467DA29|nr:uncharacterized protein LOC129727584 isoform X2 [Wyeomyia smithii]
MSGSLPQGYLTILCQLALVVCLVAGHGMVLEPIARGSRWRCNSKAPANYDDNGLYCGGYYVQWQQNGGKCGMCGDNYADATPRLHELGGPFGQGEIVRNFTMGAAIEVKVTITVNHRGHFVFNICDLDNNLLESEECYAQYQLLDTEGRREWYLNSTSAGTYLVNLQLPPYLVCEHCVLQWTYVAGNNWGYCADGTGRLGCGPQENFRTCSDIGIYDPTDDRLNDSYSYCKTSPRSLNGIYDNIPEEHDVAAPEMPTSVQAQEPETNNEIPVE